MKILLTIAATSLLALSAPAFAQEAGAPGATGVGGSMTGSNPGTGWGPGTNFAPDNSGSRYDNEGYSNGYSDDNNGGYMNEGRAAAPDWEPTGPDSPPVYAPHRYGPDASERNSDDQ